jgi:hypothetical protein
MICTAGFVASTVALLANGFPQSWSKLPAQANHSAESYAIVRLRKIDAFPARDVSRWTQHYRGLYKSELSARPESIVDQVSMIIGKTRYAAMVARHADYYDVNSELGVYYVHGQGRAVLALNSGDGALTYNVALVLKFGSIWALEPRMAVDYREQVKELSNLTLPQLQARGIRLTTSVTRAPVLRRD